MKKIILITFLLFLNTFPNYSQELLPFVENYSKSDYKGDNQIWNIAQGNDKALYFANNHYLLRYDGIKWEKNTLPNKTIIRSVFVEGDKIYSGSYKEFGYWKREKGRMIYISISQGKKIFNDSDNGEIWKIDNFSITTEALKVGDIINSEVSVEERKAITLNHSATHLLQVQISLMH